MFLIFLILFLTACSSESPHTLREEGVSKTRSLISVFRKIRTREQLLDHTEEITRYLKEFASVMQTAEIYYVTHPEETIPPLSKQEQELSDELKMHLNRLFRLDGCQEVIEKCQRGALDK